MTMPADKKLQSSTPKITTFTRPSLIESNSLKRSSNQISPADQKKSIKKAHLEKHESNNSAMGSEEHPSQQVNIQKLIEPIMQEFRSLKKTMASQQDEMSEGFNHLNSVLKEQKAEIISEINVKVDHNSE